MNSSNEVIRTTIVGLGTAAWDRFSIVPYFPGADGRVRAIKSYECGGGQIATSLVALSRWGIDCRFIGTLGRDRYSKFIREDLLSEKINIDGLDMRADADGRRANVIVDLEKHTRMIVSGPHSIPPYDKSKLLPKSFHNASYLLLDSSEPELWLDVVGYVKGQGFKILLDAEKCHENLSQLFPYCEVVIGDESFAKAYFNSGRDSAAIDVSDLDIAATACRTIYEQYGTNTAITLGVDGCCWHNCDGPGYYPAEKVQTVDTTGAGDVFHGGFAYGLYNGWNWNRCIAFATWASGRVCEKIGGRDGIPTKEEVTKWDAETE